MGRRAQSKASKRKGKRSTSGRRDIRKLDAAATKKLVRRRRVKDGWQRQYRCSLSGTVRFFKGITLRKPHIECLKTTPFYNFVLPFIKGKYSAGEVRGSQDGTVQMLLSYVKERNCFVIGGKDLKIAPSEFDLIFGIRSGDVCFRPRRTSISESDLAMRKFKGFKKLRPGRLKQVLLEHVDSDSEVDVSDTVKIIIIHILSNIFFVAGGETVNMSFFRICDNLDMLHTYNWGLAVVNYLMKSIQNRTAESVRGCTMLFMFWLCEHLKLVEPSKPNGMPRYTKWRLKDMADALNETALKDIQPTQVRSRPIKATDEEVSFLDGRVADEQSDASVNVSEGGNDIYDGFSSDDEMMVLDADEIVDVQCHGLGDSGVCSTPPTVGNAFGAGHEDNMHAASVGGFTVSESDQRPSVQCRTKDDEIGSRLSFLQSQVSMLEAALDDTKLAAKHWEAEAAMLKGKTCILEEENELLRNGTSAQEGRCTNDGRLQIEIVELKKQLRTEMRDKIEVRAELRKAEVEIDKLQQSNMMLNAEIEELKNRAASFRTNLKGSNENRSITDEGLNDLEADAMDMDVGGVVLEVEVAEMGLGGDIKEGPTVDPTDVDCVSEFHTPVQKLNATAPHVDHEPSWNLMSQPLDDGHTVNPNTDIPLTYETPSQLQIIDLHTSVNVMKRQELQLLKKLAEQEEEIKILRENNDQHSGVVVGLAAQPIVQQVVDLPVDVHEESPESLVADRTRAKRPDVTPIEMNAELDLGKNYRNYNVYRQLQFDAQNIIDELVASQNKMRYVLWKSEDNAIRILIPDIFALIRKKALSNNVVDSYTRILMIEQHKGRFGNEGQGHVDGDVYIFDSMVLQRARTSGTGRFVIPADLLGYRYIIFPILHQRSGRTRAVDHWTVLVFDNLNGDFNFYNSNLPRRRNCDPYVNDAKELQNAFYKTGRYTGIDLPFDEEIVVVSDAPQQDPASVDCGAIVLYVILKHIRHEPVVKIVAAQEMKRMHANIVETLLLWGRADGNSSTMTGRRVDGSGTSRQ